jgi:hypothetical protein
VTTHWRLSVPKPSAVCAEGRAMLTMVVSSTTINCANPTMDSNHHRRTAGCVPFEGAGRREAVRPLGD